MNNEIKCIIDNQKISSEERDYLEHIFDDAFIEYSSQPNYFININVTTTTDEISGYRRSISSISIKLLDIIRFTFETAVAISSPLALFVQFLDVICALFEKSKKVLSEKECKVLLKIYEESQNKQQVDEEYIKDHIVKTNLMTELDFRRSIRHLQHTGCIIIENGNISIIDKLKIRRNY